MTELDRNKIKEQLKVVAEMLEVEELIHLNNYRLPENNGNLQFKNFNMQVTADYLGKGEEYKCGTVACIGGWCWLLNNEKPKDEKDSLTYDENAITRADEFVHGIEGQDHGLEALFFPPFQDYAEEANSTEEEDFWETLNYNDVTNKQAAKAIRNFIEKGDPDWYSIMREESK
jgi:hypothetical protein